MKNIQLFLLVCIMAACQDQKEELYPASTINQAFIFVDSLGNNLIPNEDPNLAIVDPRTYKAIGINGNQIGSFGFTPVANGYIFRFTEPWYDIKQTSQFQKDSTITVIIQIGNELDTLICKTYKHGCPSLIIWNSDTINIQVECSVLKIIKNWQYER